MDVSLIDCDAPFLIDQKVFPPLGLLAVGTALKRQGNSVTITDNPGDASRLGFGPTTPEYPDAVAKLRQAKNQNPKTKAIIGGPHAVANADACLADGFDVVAMGDGEGITADTFSRRGVVDLGRQPLDEYPMTDRRLIDIRRYRYEIAGRQATTIMSSRGCPYRCGFCAKPDPKVRFPSVERIEAEIEYLTEDLGYNALMFFDDTFILRKKRALRICRVLKNYGTKWRCFVRGDLVVAHGRAFAASMAEAGCVEVGIGIESGSDDILDTINKGEDTTTVRKSVAILRDVGIRVKGFFIVGLPGENAATLAATRQFIEQTQLDAADFTVYEPYKGSPIWDNRHEYDIAWDDSLTASGSRFYKGRAGEYASAVRTSALTATDIIQARDNLERAFQCQQSR